MKFELDYFKQLLAELDSTGTGETDETKMEISHEYARILYVIDSFCPVTAGVSEEEFVHFHLASITRLISETEQLHSALLDSIVIGMILDRLDALVRHFYDYFPGSFNFATPLSAIAISRYLASNRSKITGTVQRLEASGISPELLSVVSDSLLLENGASPKYSNIRFGEKFINILEETGTRMDDQSLTRILISLGFNSSRFYTTYIRTLAASLTSLQTVSEQYRKLLEERRPLESIADSGKSYDPGMPPIKDLIERFLNSELNFMKELDFLASELLNAGMMEETYKVSLSVKQLAFYVYLNVECGIITEQRAKRVHQYVISHVDSVEKEGISEKSFKNAYYAHSPEDIRKVSEKLARMLAVAQSRY